MKENHGTRTQFLMKGNGLNMSERETSTHLFKKKRFYLSLTSNLCLLRTGVYRTGVRGGVVLELTC